MKLGRRSELPTADPYVPGHGDRSWSATHYALDVAYDVAANRLAGQAVIDAVAEVSLTRVVLDLAHLDVDKVSVDGKPPAKYSVRQDRLVVTLARALEAGASFRVLVKYSGRPRPAYDSDLGEAGWEELEDGVIVAGQPHGAPTWFPCNDRPDDKASYAITLRTQPDYTVVSNGRLRSRQRRGSTVTWAYEQDEPMATYLATVQIGHYELRELDSTVPMTAAVPWDAGAGVEQAFGRQPEMMTTFIELFGPYPFSSYTVVVTADDLEIPLESQTLSTFGRNYLTDDWEHVRLVAHELAHQWFGNAVTLGAWRDIWLHEGFACYSEWLWSEASGADTADTWARRHHQRLSDLDQDLVLSDPGPELMFDDRVYKRGALTLHALRLTVGDDAFFSLLRAWVAEHRGGTVSTPVLIAFAAQHTGADLGALFDSWLNQTALPDLPGAS